VTNNVRVVDDFLRFDSNFADHVKGVRLVLTAARNAGITLSLKKFTQQTVQWVGYQIQHGGIAVDPGKLKAISEFPRPTNVTEIRSFMGLVEQLAGFSVDIPTAKGPLRPLLSSKNLYEWTTDHENAFSVVKAARS
jgi:hypothetical protein